MGILDKIKEALATITSASGGGDDKSVVGIDIGSSDIKIIQLRASKGSAVLETYGEIGLGPYVGTEVGRIVKLTQDDIGQALLDLMKEANITANSTGISIPFASSLTSIVEFSKVSDSKLKQMIPLEARNKYSSLTTVFIKLVRY